MAYESPSAINYSGLVSSLYRQITTQDQRPDTQKKFFYYSTESRAPHSDEYMMPGECLMLIRQLVATGSAVNELSQQQVLDLYYFLLSQHHVNQLNPPYRACLSPIEEGSEECMEADYSRHDAPLAEL